VPLHCPLHDDRRESLLVWVDTLVAKCLAGCNGGRMLPINAFYDGIAIEKTGNAPSIAQRRNAVTRCQQDLRAVLGYIVSTEEALRQAGNRSRIDGEVAVWLESRGLSAEIVSRWVFCGSDGLEMRLRGRFGERMLTSAGLLSSTGRVLFGPGRRPSLVCRDPAGAPVWAQLAATTAHGRVRAKYLSPGVVPVEPFGLDTVAGKRTVVVTEGIVDALTVLQYGEWDGDGVHTPAAEIGVVGLCGVAAPMSRAMSLAVRLAGRGARYVVATDPDAAGDGAADRIFRELHKLGAKNCCRWRLAGDLNEERPLSVAS
jgi:hypothetical protein